MTTQTGSVVCNITVSAMGTWLARTSPKNVPSATMAAMASATGGTPARWYQLVVHRQHVTPATPLT
jgi:hypothetical protein